MNLDFLQLAFDFFQKLNQTKIKFNKQTEKSNFQIKLNDIVGEEGIGLKTSFFLSGPNLKTVMDVGKKLFKNKKDNDVFFFFSIKTKGDPQGFIDDVNTIIDAFGLPMNMVEKIGELKMVAGKDEAFIGFISGEHEYKQLAQGFSLNSSVFGDGKEDIFYGISANLATTLTQ
jgi:hypothetical protein